MNWVGLGFGLVVILVCGAILEYARRFHTILQFSRHGSTMCDLKTDPIGFWFNLLLWTAILLTALVMEGAAIARGLHWMAN